MTLATPGRYSGISFAAIDGKGRVAIPASLRNNLPLIETASKETTDKKSKKSKTDTKPKTDKTDTKSKTDKKSKNVKHSKEERILWVGYHDRLPCLIAFGQDQYDRLYDEIEVERTTSLALKLRFDEDAEYKRRFSWIDPYSLDGSGRFIPNAIHRRRTGATGGIAFVGAGKRFEIWSVVALAACDEADSILREMASEMFTNDGGSR